MSNFRAIATVTAALSQQIRSAVIGDVAGTTITFGRPDTPSGTPAARVNIYLFQVTPCPAFRNVDAPTRRADGTFIQRPRAALELHYLLSFYGNESQLQPQMLLGSVVRTLHAHPTLSPDLIRDTLNVPGFSFLVGSDLAEAVELVKFTPMALSLEDMGRIWSVFFQTPYALSVAYQASVVLLDHTETVPSAPAVLSPSVAVRPAHTPFLDTIEAEGGGLIVPDSVLRLTGQRLRASEGETQIHLTGDDSITVVPNIEATNEALRLPLTGHPLAAGVQGVEVIHALPLSEASPTLYPIFRSDVAAFVLHPTADSATQETGTLNVTVTPDVQPGQSVQLELLSEEGSIVFIARPAPPVAVTDSLDFSLESAPTGTWRVRVRVDGAESPLDGAPEVTVP